METTPKRIIGVVGDGRSDREILAKLCEAALSVREARSPGLRVVPLPRQSIRDDVDRYWREMDSPPADGDPSEKLANAVTNMLHGAVLDLRNSVDRPVSARDMIVVASDSERFLRTKEAFFEDWAWRLDKVVWKGIQKYCHALSNHGHSKDSIPLIVPFIPFPSSDVLVAVARSASGENLPHRGRRPGELKRILYGTDNLRLLRPEDLNEKALQFISPSALPSLYSALPEVRFILAIFALV